MIRKLLTAYKFAENNIKIVLCVLISLNIILYIAGFFLIFIAPEDGLQGMYAKIMYIHVPSAWLGIAIYSVMAVLSFISLFLNTRFSDILAYSLSHIGASFTLICLITGSIWGRPIWNTWWVWDARLTSMFILLLLYISYIILWDYGLYYSKIASIINVLGLINIPIIKFSVDIWITLHQPSSIFRKAGVAIDESMLWPLITMFLAAMVLTLWLWIIKIKTTFNEYKIRNIIQQL